MAEELPDIGALDRAGIARFIAQAGQRPYRVTQIVAWLYGRDASSFEQMTDLPRSLRDLLAASFSISRPATMETLGSSDGTRKYLWRLADAATVEGVGIPSDDRLTVCFSTQAGCAMACSFCATGQGGFVRDLTCGEMVGQVQAVSADFGARVTNAVAMGQGEPFLNYDATLAALRFMNAEDGLGIGARHLTVSTSGVLPAIRQFAQEPEQFTLAISLHSAVQSKRDRLMPGVRRWPLSALRAELAAYAESTGRRVTLEYALIDGVNDADADLVSLEDFCRGLLCHVNLIPMNPVAGSRLRRSAEQRTLDIRAVLDHMGIETTIRAERGSDISAACGQLAQRAVADR